MPDSPLELHHRTLPDRGPATRLLVLVHGYGESPDALTGRLDLLDPEGRFHVVVPDAPFEHRGARIWHRALSTSPELAAEQYVASMHALDRLLVAVCAATGLPSDTAVVGGFSQGGGLAFGLLASADVITRPAAAFGVCSFAPSIGGFRVDPAAALGRACLAVSASRDHFAPPELSRVSAAALAAIGLEVSYEEIDSAHEMTDEAAAIVGRWLSTPAEERRRGRSDELLRDADVSSSFYDGLWETVD
jgi:predicted esterase